MKKTLSAILVIVFILSICFSLSAFADTFSPEYYIYQMLLGRGNAFSSDYPEMVIQKVTDVGLTNCYCATFLDGSKGYYFFYPDDELPYMEEITSPYATSGAAVPVFMSTIFPGASFSLVTDVPGLTNCYAVYFSGSDAPCYVDFEATRSGTNAPMHNINANNQLFVSAGLSLERGTPVDSGGEIDPFTGYYFENPTVKCSVYDLVAPYLLPNDPHAKSTSGGGGSTPAGKVSTGGNEEQMINYITSGSNSYSVTIPTQYTSSTDTDGNVFLHGVFSLSLSDLEGDGTYKLALILLSAENTANYYKDDAGKIYDAPGEGRSEYQGTYMVNPDVEGAKIQYDILDSDSMVIGFGEDIISKTVTTTAADFGPVSETVTIDFLLDPEGVTPIEDIPHGTYTDVLTFQTSVTPA